MTYLLRELPESERPREKLERLGAEYLSTPELIAIILRTGTKNQSVLSLAHEINTRFNHSNQLKYVTLDELMTIKGIGKAKAIQLLAAIELGKRIHTSKLVRGMQITSPIDCVDYIADELKFLEQEHFIGVYLDSKNRVLAKKTLFVGSLNRSICHPREIFKEALRHACNSIIVIHNHPSGSPAPSPQDIAVTKRLYEIGELVGIELLDHIIIGTEGYVSLRAEGLI